MDFLILLGIKYTNPLIQHALRAVSDDMIPSLCNVHWNFTQFMAYLIPPLRLNMSEEVRK